MVELIVENEYSGPEITEEQIAELKRVCEKVMEIEECDFDAEISFTFTDNDGSEIPDNASLTSPTKADSILSLST